MIRDHRDRSYWIIPVNLSEVQDDLRDPFEFDDPRHGTRLTVYRSLRRVEGIQPSICEQNFLSEMSRKVEQENASATYVLKNTFQERPATSDLLPMLGRSIISDSVRWGSNQLRIHGDFNFIAAYHCLAKKPESKKGVSAQQWVKYWYKGEINYASLVKRRRNSNSTPKHTHNPDGVLKDRPTTWIRAQGAKCFNGQEARVLIHEGSRAEVGCTILNKNRIELLFDDGTLKLAHFDYLTLWLFKGSRSRVYAPCVALNWHDLTTPRFQNWWSKVSISDLRDKVVVLCSSIESDPLQTKRKSPNDARDVAQPHCIDSNPEPIAKTQSLHIPSRKDDISTKVNKVFDNDKSTSDAESDVNFKHQRGRRSKKPRVADSEGDETDFGNAFDNIPIPSDIPTDLTKVGDIHFEMGVSFNVDDAMIEEATEPLNVLTDRTDLVERSNSASPAQSQHSVDGPSTFEINAKTLGTPLDDRGIPRAPSHGDAAPAPSISTIRVTPASQGIFTSAIKILGNEYLTLLKQTPFDKVFDRHGEASQVYKAIRMMHGDPEPLKCKVDGYVWAVKGHLALKESLSDRRQRLAAVEELKLAESSYDTALTKHKGLEEESVALKQKKDELLKELEDVRQRMDKVTSDLGDNRNSLTTLEATVHSTKRRVEELEAVLVCSAEEMELFEEQERKLLEFQSSLDSSEWIV
ncbi:hypothetical protein RDABS01_013748 [Bienertia sinuspersici]